MSYYHSTFSYPISLHNLGLRRLTTAVQTIFTCVAHKLLPWEYIPQYHDIEQAPRVQLHVTNKTPSTSSSSTVTATSKLTQQVRRLLALSECQPLHCHTGQQGDLVLVVSSSLQAVTSLVKWWDVPFRILTAREAATANGRGVYTISTVLIRLVSDLIMGWRSWRLVLCSSKHLLESLSAPLSVLIFIFKNSVLIFRWSSKGTLSITESAGYGRVKS